MHVHLYEVYTVTIDFTSSRDHSCIASTQRRHPPSCMRSNALLISARGKLWVTYSSTLISCKMITWSLYVLSIKLIMHFHFHTHSSLMQTLVQKLYLLHVLLHKPRHLWSALEATKCCSFPYSPSHQLERSSTYFLTWSCNPHNNWHPPTLQFFNKYIYI